MKNLYSMEWKKGKCIKHCHEKPTATYYLWLIKLQEKFLRK